MDLEHRARVHAALADAHRLRIVDALAPSDLTPSELGSATGIGGSLLAHHLRVLEGAGIVASHRSEGDGRRRYVHLLRPDVATAVEPVDRPVVFVCTHNSARSQLAEAVWRHRIGSPAASAGTEPADAVHPGAVAAAAAAGYDLGGAEPRLVDRGLLDGALVVSVCDRAHEDLGSTDAHWSVPDPVRVGTDAAFAAALVSIDDWISRRYRHAG